jgi:hypothetical protein
MMNVRNCYELIDMPSGLVALGDCVQGLNPVYGQVNMLYILFLGRVGWVGGRTS